MRIGVVTGSGSYDWPHLEGAAERTVVTDHGEVTVTEGRLGGAEIVNRSATPSRSRATTRRPEPSPRHSEVSESTPPP